MNSWWTRVLDCPLLRLGQILTYCQEQQQGLEFWDQKTMGKNCTPWHLQVTLWAHLGTYFRDLITFLNVPTLKVEVPTLNGGTTMLTAGKAKMLSSLCLCSVYTHVRAHVRACVCVHMCCLCAKWVAVPSSMGSSWSKDQTHVSYVSCIGRQVLYRLSHQGNLLAHVRTRNTSQGQQSHWGNPHLVSCSLCKAVTYIQKTTPSLANWPECQGTSSGNPQGLVWEELWTFITTKAEKITTVHLGSLAVNGSFTPARGMEF